LYLFLKEHERSATSETMRIKLGRDNHAWVKGLIAYGDDHGWKA
jgi:hypothetical protein